MEEIFQATVLKFGDFIVGGVSWQQIRYFNTVSPKLHNLVKKKPQGHGL